MPCDVISIEEAAAPALSVGSINVPGSKAVGESFTVTATVENTGGASGSGTVIFTQDGSEIKRRDVSVPANSYVRIQFQHSIGTTGTYDICAEMA